MWPQSCDQSFLAILLKDAKRSLFRWPQVTPGPARTRAACVSLSLFTMSISKQGINPKFSPQPHRREKLRIPLSGHPAATPACQLSAQKHAAQTNAPRPSVMGLIWPPGPKCQHPKTSKRQKNDKCLNCNIHSPVTMARNRAWDELPGSPKPSGRSKTSPPLGTTPPAGPFRSSMLCLP